MDFEGGTAGATHLCVLIHGLWGRPAHMHNIARTLRERHPPDSLWLLCSKTNEGNRTYDGVEHGGERVCAEIEAEMQAMAEKGGRVEKLSLIGYSLGGVIARYVVGLLEAKGVLAKLECMTFATFASPHLGARIPVPGFLPKVWNRVSPPTISVSGKHLFLTDTFRDTARPLLAVLADPQSVFIAGLARFRRRTAYGNVTNDRAVMYYTSAFSPIDPFADLSRVKVKYVDGYEDVVLDPEGPVIGEDDGPRAKLHSFNMRLVMAAVALGSLMLSPLIIPTFAAFTAIGAMRSCRRMRNHDAGRVGVNTEEYRKLLLWVGGGPGPAGPTAAEQDPESSLSAADGPSDDSTPATAIASPTLSNSDTAGGATGDGQDHPMMAGDGEPRETEKIEPDAASSLAERFPALDLLPIQREMIEGLDTLTWHKYAVWIHHHLNSHGAVIVRHDSTAFWEGRVVLRHFVTEEFVL